MHRAFRLFLILGAGCGSDSQVTSKVAEDGAAAPATACDEVTWFRDGDGDGHGGDESVFSCEPPSDGYTEVAGDCNDTDPTVFPSAEDICNGVDDNCNGAVDEGHARTEWYTDADGDGFGDSDSVVIACEQRSGTAADSGDCDDSDAGVFPGAVEVCNEIDDNCDGEVDEGVGPSEWYRDLDGDGRGDPFTVVTACAQPSGYVANTEDCDDSDASNWAECEVLSEGTCNDVFYSWSAYAHGQPELHIVSVYESNGGHGGRPGSITVNIDRPGNVVLVLSSYEPVEWTVNERSGTTIDEVILNGYYDQRLVAGATGATVSTHTYYGTGSFIVACSYEWPSSTGGCDTVGLVSGAESMTGLRLSSYAGCYHGREFSVY
ncbi:MAG: hypothetical protein CL927_12425 [Deltaproteobacteria bacterium]|nr:hypothetical protein [Deltaproteobacteria bacterium]HCH63338.1 hypothetical protein [Deltaproteobacteria bacterium]